MKNNPRAYVAYWLTDKKISIDEKGALSSPDKRDYHDLFDTMFLDYTEEMSALNFVLEKKVRIAPEKLMQQALNEYISLDMLKKRNLLIKNLAHTGDNLVPLEAFVIALTGLADKKITGVLAHFIWMIKRKLMDKEVVHHIMPIIYGKQGAGKSYAIEKRLLDPISNLSLRIRLTELTDPRFFFSLNKNFVAFLDEMAGATKTDVEVLKNQVTASYNDARKLNTNIVTKIKQNCSLIGCTNRPVNELIYDTTGSRRFYEIRSLDNINWNAINGIDYVALYRGVDEKLERGYIEPFLSEIAMDQENLTGIDELNVFIEQHGLKEEGKTKEITCAALYQLYKDWAEQNGMKALNSVWFGRKISNKGIKSFNRKVGVKSERYYMVYEGSIVHRKSTMVESLKEPVKLWDN